MANNTHDTSWTQIGFLWLIVLVLFGFLFTKFGCQKTVEKTPEAISQAEDFRQRMEKLKEKLNHPKVREAFSVGFAFGERHKGTGLSRLTEQQLEIYAVEACKQLDVDQQVHGEAVKKFKSGYGWGYSVAR